MHLFALPALLFSTVALVNATPAPRGLIDELTHLITGIDVVITLDTFTTNNVSLSFGVQNPLIVPLRVNSIETTASLNGTKLASFTHSFANFVTPVLGTANSGTINNVALTQGLTASLAFVPEGILNIQAIINLDIGILPVPIFPYAQNSIPTTYDISVD